MEFSPGLLLMLFIIYRTSFNELKFLCYVLKVIRGHFQKLQ